MAGLPSPEMLRLMGLKPPQDSAGSTSSLSPNTQEDDSNVVTDSLTGLGRGVSRFFAGTAGDAVTLLPGTRENWFSELNKSIEDSLNKVTSQTSRQSLDRMNRSVEQAGQEWSRGKTGFSAFASEVAGQFTEAVSQIVSNPADIAIPFIAEQIPNVLGITAIGKGVAKKAASRAVSRGATAEQAARAGARAGSAAAIGTGAALEGSSVGGETFDKVMSLDQSILDQDQDYREYISGGMSPDEARKQVALDASRKVGAAVTALTAITGKFLPGIENAVTRGAVGRTTAGRVGVTAAAETGQEMLEEGGGQFIQNLGVQSVDPSQNLAEGVGLGAALGGITGGVTGGAVGALSSGRESQPQQDNIVTRDLINALGTVSGNQPQTGTPLLESPQALNLRTASEETTLRVQNLNLTPRQIIERASVSEDPRIQNILQQGTSADNKAQQIARIYNAEDAARLEPQIINSLSSAIDGRTKVSEVAGRIRDELSRIGDEVVAESRVLSQLRDLVATNESGKLVNRGDAVIGGIRSVVRGYRPTAPQGGEFVARPERGGEGSVIVPRDQFADEAQRERQADQAFRLADVRQRRFEQAQASGQQREDLRPGAAQPTAQFFLDPRVYGDRLGGKAATITQIADRPDYVRIQYEDDTDIVNGRPVIVSEEVPIESLNSRVVRGSPRMSQELAGDLVSPPRGVGKEMPGPRASVDRTSTRAVQTQESGPPAVIPPPPNFTFEGTRQRAPEPTTEVGPVRQRRTAIEGEAATQPPAVVPDVGGVADNTPQIEAPAQQLPAPPRGLPAPPRGLPAPPRALPAPENTETTEPTGNRAEGRRRAEIEADMEEGRQQEIARQQQEEPTFEDGQNYYDNVLFPLRERIRKLEKDGVISKRERIALLDRTRVPARRSQELDPVIAEVEALENSVEDDEIDIDNHPLMVAHDEKYDNAVSEIYDAEDLKGLRSLAKRFVRNGLIDDLTDFNEAIAEAERGEKFDTGQGALEGLLEDAREEKRSDVEDEIRADTQYSTRGAGRVETVRRFTRDREAAAPDSEVVLRARDGAQSTEAPPTRQTPRRESSSAEQERAREIIADALNKLKARGQAGRVLANRVESLIDSGRELEKLVVAFRASDAISRVVGGARGLDFVFVDSMFVQGAERQGSFTRYPVSENGFNAVLQISLEPRWWGIVTETGGHEAFHALQSILRESDPKLYAALNSSFRNGMTIDDLHPALRRELQRSVNPVTGQTYWDSLRNEWGDKTWSGFGPRENSLTELQAYVFGALHDARMEGAQLRTLPAMFGRALDFFTNIAEAVKNAANGLGFTTTQQIFRDASTGRLTQGREVPTAGASPQFSSRRKKPVATQPGKGVSSGNVGGFSPDLRVKVSGVELPEKALVLATTNNKNAAKQIDKLDGILDMFPNAGVDANEWSGMMAYALASDEVPIPPYRFISDLSNGKMVESLRRLQPGQIEDANHGFDNAREFRRAYINKELDVVTTGKLFMWSFLSRGVSPYTQESLFIDAFNGVDKWIRMAARGEFTEANLTEYRDWASSVAQKGSGQPGAGATHNLNAFGKDFLLKMGRPDEYGTTPLQRLHNMMEDSNQTGRSIRREFLKFGEGVGIDNKVVSFTLLVAGFNDVMVLDRVQIRQLWDDGRFNGKNLYDGQRNADGNTITGTSLAQLTFGVRGLLVYEAIERALDSRIASIYSELGRPQDASIGRFHWETWVADSQQEASHGTIDAILKDAKGDDYAIASVAAKQGEYGAYEYGASYGRKMDGEPYFLYTVPDGRTFEFSVPDFRAFLSEIKRPGTGVVPGKFKVTEAGNEPWYNRPEVNRERLAEVAGQYGSRVGSRGREAPIRRADAVEVANDTRSATAESSPQFSTRSARPFSADQRELAAELRSRFPTRAGTEGRLNGSGYVGSRSGGVLASDLTGRVPARRTHFHDPEVVALYESYGASAPEFLELPSGAASARAFSRLITDAKTKDDYGAAVYVYDEADYRDMRLFTTADGRLGFALKGDDIVSVFKHPESTDKLAAYSMIRMAVALGGRRLDAFDTVLPNIYSVGGFRVAARMKWDDEYSPADWDKGRFAAFNNGEPDVVFMAFDPNRSDLYEEGEGEYTDNYDTAVNMQKRASLTRSPKAESFFSTRRPQSEAFDRWSGGAPFVSVKEARRYKFKTGEPVVVEAMHGTAGDIESFDPEKRGSLTRARSAKGAFWFSDSSRVADYYSRLAARDAILYGRNRKANVINAYLRMNNPLVVDLKNKVYREEPFRSIIERAKAEGHDGVILTRAYDSGEHSKLDALLQFKLRGDTLYAVFEPTQIKSTDNVGTFDPNDNRIRFSTRTRINQSALPKNLVAASSARTPLRPAPSFNQEMSGFDALDPSRIDKLIYELQDKNIDLKRVQQAINRAGRDIADDKDAYLREELSHGRSAEREKDFRRRELNPLITEMRAKNITIAELDQFLHARHAEEANKQIARINPDLPDGGSGMTTQAAKDYLDGLTPIKRRQLEGLAKRVDDIIRKTQKMAVQYGIESQETIDGWNKAFKYYVPLRREGFEEEVGSEGGRGVSNAGPMSKTRMGSSLGVVDILANIALQRSSVISRGERNRIAQGLMNLALANPNAGFWFVIDPKSDSMEEASRKLIEFGVSPNDAAEIKGAPLKRVKNSAGQVVYRPNPNLAGLKHVISLRVNGENKFILFNSRDPRAARMAESLKNADVEALEGITALSAKISRYFASISTQYNPVFGIINLMRDLLGATLNLSSTAIAGQQRKVILNSIPALFGMYGDLRAQRRGETVGGEWAALAEEFGLAGGKTGFRELFASSTEQAKAIEKELNSGSVNVGMKTAGAVFDWLSDFNEAIENGIRLSAYKAAKDSGMSNERAASLAKNLTVNFNRKGRRGVAAGAFYAFFNANVQGTARLAETLRGPAGKKIVLGGILLGVAQSVALAAAGLGDDELPEWVKDKNLIIPVGNRRYAAIPMPLGFHVIPALGRRLAEVIAYDRDPAREIFSLFGLFADAFNPIGNAGLSLQTIAPTPLDFAVAIVENKDYAGRTIYNEKFDKNDPRPGFERNRAGVSPVGDFVARAIDYITGGSGYTAGMISPTGDEVDYVIGQLTGGVGREVMKVFSVAKTAASGEELPAYKIPLVGRLGGNANEGFAVSNRFAENVRLMRVHEEEIESRAEEGVDTTEYINDHPEAAIYPSIKAVDNEVKKLRKIKRQLMEQDDYSREDVAAIDEQIGQMQATVNQMVAEIKRAQNAS